MQSESLLKQISSDTYYLITKMISFRQHLIVCTVNLLVEDVGACDILTLTCTEPEGLSWRPGMRIPLQTPIPLPDIAPL